MFSRIWYAEVAEQGGQGRELTGELPGMASVGTITIAFLFPDFFCPRLGFVLSFDTLVIRHFALHRLLS